MDRGTQPAPLVEPAQYKWRRDPAVLPEYNRRVIVAGSRDYDDYRFFSEGMHDYVRVFFGPEDKLVFITGLARTGADALIVRWCEEFGYPWVGFAADWDDIDSPGAVVRYTRRGKPYNVRAGYIRNGKMADVGTNLIVWWDGVSGGTRDMREQATRRKLTVFTVLIDLPRIESPDHGRQS